nr:CPBP family intramembrane glutamic endopeptidase [Pelagicoccus albus]
MLGPKSLLTILVVIGLAPIMEELIFRGYLFKAWRPTWLGSHGVVILTSFLFACIHIGQYHWIVLLQLMLLAMIIGYAREKTGSLIPCIAIHATNNLYALVAISLFPEG